MFDHIARPAQISPAIYSPAAQRSAVRCRAVRCRALPCAAVLCRVALCFISNIQQYQGYTWCCILFVLLFLHLALSVPMFPPHANYARTADQNVASPTITQHSTGQSALNKHLLALSNRCSHQIMSLFFLPPLHVLVAFFLAQT